MSSPDATADAERPHGRVRRAALYLVVAAFQVYATDGFQRTVDLSVTDDCSYLWNGRLLFAGSPDWRDLIAWSGPYDVLYGLLDLLHLGRDAPDVMCALLALASTLALLWALSGVASMEAAAAGALLWATGSAYISGPWMNGVYAFGATLAFLGAGLLVRGRDAAGAAVLLVAAATRPELLLWIGGTGLVAALLGRRKAGLALALGTAALLALQVAVDHHDRSGIAFRQHYALGVAEERARQAGRPVTSAEDVPGYAFEHPEAWVRESFGDATTLPGALAANPAEVGRHVLRNLYRFAREVALPLAGRFPGAVAAQGSAGVVLGALAAVGLADLLGALRRRRALGSRSSAWTTALILASPMLAATSILYGPRVSYVIAGFLPLVLLALRGARRLGSLQLFRRFPWLGTAPSERALLGLAGLLVIVLSMPRPSDGPPSWSLQWRKIVSAAEREGGALAVLGESHRADVLLLPGATLRGTRAGIPDDVDRVLLHATDLSKYGCERLPAEEDAVVRRLVEGGEWRPLRYRDEVLLMVRKGP